MTHTIAVTPGEPAGIGPDICIQYAQSISQPHNIIYVCDPTLIEQRADELNIDIKVQAVTSKISDTPSAPGTIFVLPVKLAHECITAIPDKKNSSYVLNCLDQAVKGCQEGYFNALVTGPVNKGIINDAGFPFSGHTEYLADLCGQNKVVMMLATEGLRVALATTHLPLSDVPAAITRDLLEQIITILHADLVKKFGLENPRIYVTGLNPHAGEDGHLGHEEIDTIIPVLESFRTQGLDLIGPMPADTLFTPKYLDYADAVLAMYHDQGLPVLKHMGFGDAVNITLGLPIIRTSVDHGTAFDVAGTGKADIGSLSKAIETAVLMADNWTT